MTTRASLTRAGLVIAWSLAGLGCYSGLDGSGPGADGGGDGADTGDDGGNDGADDGGSEGGSDDGPSVAEDDPGRVTLHRLNRAEYDNTIRDLFWGLDVSPADGFPADDHSLGFDNIADVLSMTPVLFELYERAAEHSIEAAMATNIAGESQRVEAEEAGGTTGAAVGEFWNLSSNGTVSAAVELPGDGEYRVTVRAYQQAGGPDDANMVVLVDGLQVASFDVAALADAPGEYEIEVDLTAGAHTVVAEFTNDFFDEDLSADRNLLIDWIEVAALDGGGPLSVRDKLLVCEPGVDGDDGCAREILAAFVPRAWRRPTKPGELDALMAVFAGAQAEGNTWEAALQVALKATLISPNFIFRVELDPEPGSLTPHGLNEYEIASRLSYFLWSSMPDDGLFERAAAGELSDPEILRLEVARMIDNERSAALVANFFGQWLWVRALADPLSKDYDLYPAFDEALQASMVMETTLFLETFLTEGRSMKDILVAEESFIDASLAELYGLPVPAPGDVDSNGFARVAFDGAPRRGLLTQGGLMSILSHPNVTSPVRRGKWVLEQLLCRPPPAPPPGVEVQPIEPTEGGTMREQLEQHRQDPTCAACHNLMDPLGLGLENYDAIGAYREMEAGYQIDASGTLPDGTAFDNALEMSALLADSEDFSRCTIRKTMIYALGRDVGPSDVPYIDAIEADFVAGEMTLEALIVAVATNETFTMRHGETE